jgi:hypothetical protein
MNNSNPSYEEWLNQTKRQKLNENEEYIPLPPMGTAASSSSSMGLSLQAYPSMYQSYPSTPLQPMMPPTPLHASAPSYPPTQLQAPTPLRPPTPLHSSTPLQPPTPLHSPTVMQPLPIMNNSSSGSYVDNDRKVMNYTGQADYVELYSYRPYSPQPITPQNSQTRKRSRDRDFYDTRHNSAEPRHIDRRRSPERDRYRSTGRDTLVSTHVFKHLDRRVSDSAVKHDKHIIASKPTYFETAYIRNKMQYPPNRLHDDAKIYVTDNSFRLNFNTIIDGKQVTVFTIIMDIGPVMEHLPAFRKKHKLYETNGKKYVNMSYEKDCIAHYIFLLKTINEKETRKIPKLAIYYSGDCLPILELCNYYGMSPDDPIFNRITNFIRQIYRLYVHSFDEPMILIINSDLNNKYDLSTIVVEIFIIFMIDKDSVTKMKYVHERSRLGLMINQMMANGERTQRLPFISKNKITSLYARSLMEYCMSLRSFNVLVAMVLDAYHRTRQISQTSTENIEDYRYLFNDATTTYRKSGDDNLYHDCKTEITPLFNRRDRSAQPTPSASSSEAAPISVDPTSTPTAAASATALTTPASV